MCLKINDEVCVEFIVTYVAEVLSEAYAKCMFGFSNVDQVTEGTGDGIN